METPTITPFGPKGKERIAAEEALKAGVPGDEITRAKAEQLIGIPCGKQSRGEGAMQRAVDFLITHDGPYWEWSRDGQCWRCLTNEQIVRSLAARKKRATRCHTKNVKASMHVDQSNLSAEDRRDFQLTQLQSQLAIHVASRPMRDALIGTDVLERLQMPGASDMAKLMSNHAT